MDLDEKEETPKENKIEIEKYYRAVLCNPTGLYVLADIARMCHFFEELPIDDPAKIAEYNVGQKIFARCVEDIDATYELNLIQALVGLKRS